MVVLREELVLYTPLSMKQEEAQKIIFSITQKISHQWILIVTLLWWSDYWIIESLARYNSHIALDQMSGEHAIERNIADELLLFLHEGRHSSLSENIHAKFEEIKTVLDEINYGKCTLLLRMAHLLIGKESLKEILFSFLKKNAFQIIDKNDLWESFENSAPAGAFSRRASLSEVMKTWSYQEGYPLVTVERDYEKQTAILTQKDFFNSNDVKESCWWIPITYTTRSENRTENTKVRDWMKCPKESLELEQISAVDWVMLNLQMGSIFRVNYDMKNWILLGSTLKDPRRYKQIPRFNRMQLIDDIFTFARSGMISYDFLLDFSSYLEHEEEYSPWTAATQNILKLYWRLSSNSQALLKKYMQKLLRRQFKSKKVEVKEHSSVGLELRKMLLECSCFFELKDCLDAVKKSFRKFKESSSPANEENGIPVEIRHIIFCYAIKHGSSDDFRFLLNAWHQSQNALERQDMLNALYCTLDSALLEKIPRRLRRRVKFPKHNHDEDETDDRSSRVAEIQKKRDDSDGTNNTSISMNDDNVLSDSNESTENPEDDSNMSSTSVKDEIPDTTQKDDSFTGSTSSTDIAIDGSSSGLQLKFILLRSKFDIAAPIFYDKLKTANKKEAAEYIRSFTEMINNEKDLKVFIDFCSINQENLQSIQDIIDERINIVKQNLEWQTNNSELVDDALRQYLKIPKEKKKSGAVRNYLSTWIIYLNLLGSLLFLLLFEM